MPPQPRVAAIAAAVAGPPMFAFEAISMDCVESPEARPNVTSVTMCTVSCISRNGTTFKPRDSAPTKFEETPITAKKINIRASPRAEPPWNKVLPCAVEGFPICCAVARPEATRAANARLQVGKPNPAATASPTAQEKHAATSAEIRVSDVTPPPETF